MGFWSSVGKVTKTVGEAALNNIKESNERYASFKSECADYSDSKLCDIVNKHYNSSNFQNKQMAAAAFQELKSRGFTAEDIKAMK